MHLTLKAGIAALGIACLGITPLAMASGGHDRDDHDRHRGHEERGYEVELTIIHTGDFHGHLIPRANIRSDGDGSLEGGLARVAAKINQIRRHEDNVLHVHTGDTIQGSAEALYTRGQALVDVVDMLGVDAFAPGNWEFVYGTQRFVELFGDGRWGTVSTNVRYEPAAGEPSSAGDYVSQPYMVKHIGGLKVGILGFTTDRGPQVVGSAVTEGLCFLSSNPDSTAIPDVSEVEAELRAQVAKLRNEEKVDILIMISELGLANNSLLAERNDGIDFIFSSDMHEETLEPAVVTTPNGGHTVVVEVGQDGTLMGAMEIEFDRRKGGSIKEWEWEAWTVHESWPEDPAVAAKIAEVRAPFVSGTFQHDTHVNPFNGSVLNTPIDTGIGTTAVGLHRSNFSHEDLPGLIEGTSHDFLTDAYRTVAGTDIGAIRGFRYGTHVAPGVVKLEDIYHYMPIGAQIARGDIRGQGLKNQIENPADGSMNPDPRRWGGGWLFGFSGVTFDLDPYLTRGNRASNVQVGGVPLDLAATYSYASYWYATDPTLINRVPANNIEIAVRGTDGKALFVPLADRGMYPAMDGTEIVWEYLRDHLGGHIGEADLVTHRVNLLRPLPAPIFGNPEVQSLRGVQ